MGRVLFFIALLAVIIYALVDCIGSHARDVRSIPKSAWLAVIVLLPLVGAGLWFALGRPRDEGEFQSRPAPRRPAAPDDDPNFLRNLDSTRRQEAEDQRLKEWEQQLKNRERNIGHDDPGPDHPSAN